jgi:hypothetical protein
MLAREKTKKGMSEKNPSPIRNTLGTTNTGAIGY